MQEEVRKLCCERRVARGEGVELRRLVRQTDHAGGAARVNEGGRKAGIGISRSLATQRPNLHIPYTSCALAGRSGCPLFMACLFFSCLFFSFRRYPVRAASANPRATKSNESASALTCPAAAGLYCTPACLKMHPGIIGFLIHFLRRLRPSLNATLLLDPGCVKIVTTPPRFHPMQLKLTTSAVAHLGLFAILILCFT